ncbi:aldo/keto reductase [Streptomyces sp. NPDC002870]|uniref:aldo/keto reductase n=1 Tax=Streptomyces sp. NPDC002870 TaxID=3364666 RepID=UPI003677FDCE
MRYRRLGDSDIRIPLLTFGCGNFGGIGSAPELFGQGDDERSAHQMLDAALAEGITMFDTANSYGGGRSEQWLGSWLRSRAVRDEVLITTKVGNRVGPGPLDAGLSAAHIRSQVEASLSRLGTDHIDLYLTHVSDPATPVEETIRAFDELIDTGKILRYGMSNFSASDFDEAVSVADRLGARRPVNLQAGYNLLERDAEPELASSARHGAGFTAYSPLAGGLLTGKYRADREVPAGSRLALLPSYGKLVGSELYGILGRLDVLAAQHGRTPTALALAWVLSEPAVSGALIAPRTQAQLEAMSAALDISLTPQERNSLAGIAPVGERCDKRGG